MKTRTTAAAVAAALIAVSAGPSTTTAFASTHTPKRLTRAEQRAVKELKALEARDATTSPPTGAGLGITDLIQNLQWVLSPADLQAALGDLPVVGLYG